MNEQLIGALLNFYRCLEKDRLLISYLESDSGTTLGPRATEYLQEVKRGHQGISFSSLVSQLPFDMLPMLATQAPKLSQVQAEIRAFQEKLEAGSGVVLPSRDETGLEQTMTNLKPPTKSQKKKQRRKSRKAKLTTRVETPAPEPEETTPTEPTPVEPTPQSTLDMNNLLKSSLNLIGQTLDGKKPDLANVENTIDQLKTMMSGFLPGVNLNSLFKAPQS